MIIGTGVDIVEIDRFTKIDNLEGLAKKILHANELKEFNKKAKNKNIFLAKKFAFKEAFVKALGTGFREPYYLNRIEIIKDKLGKPSVITHEEAKKEFEDLGITKAHVSLSDTENYVVAFVVLEK
tara:strand:- start:2515 stop:2889 length:375 start_codon:yes stop_codon:yes gene_type:complete